MYDNTLKFEWKTRRPYVYTQTHSDINCIHDRKKELKYTRGVLAQTVLKKIEPMTGVEIMDEVEPIALRSYSQGNDLKINLLLQCYRYIGRKPVF